MMKTVVSALLQIQRLLADLVDLRFCGERQVRNGQTQVAEPAGLGQNRCWSRDSSPAAGNRASCRSRRRVRINCSSSRGVGLEADQFLADVAAIGQQARLPAPAAAVRCRRRAAVPTAVPCRRFWKAGMAPERISSMRATPWRIVAAALQNLRRDLAAFALAELVQRCQRLLERSHQRRLRTPRSSSGAASVRNMPGMRNATFRSGVPAR